MQLLVLLVLASLRTVHHHLFFEPQADCDTSPGDAAHSLRMCDRLPAKARVVENARLPLLVCDVDRLWGVEKGVAGWVLRPLAIIENGGVEHLGGRRRRGGVTARSVEKSILFPESLKLGWCGSQRWQANFWSRFPIADKTGVLDGDRFQGNVGGRQV